MLDDYPHRLFSPWDGIRTDYNCQKEFLLEYLKFLVGPKIQAGVHISTHFQHDDSTYIGYC